MATLPFTEQQCFFVAMLVFIVVGFQRGWRRELVTLVFVLLGAFIVRPDSSRAFGDFLARLPSTIGYLLSGRVQQGTTSAPLLGFLGPWGSLLAFALIVALGYFVGSRAFPRPSAPAERFIGIVPAIVYGAVILYYLQNYLYKDPSGHSTLTVSLQSPDPSNYVPILFVIAIIAVIIGLLVSRTKKSGAPPAKK